MSADPILEVFGARLLRARRARGWSCRDLAAKSGVSAPTVNRAEHGLEMVLSSAVRLAAALDIPLGDLLAAADCDRCDGHPPSGFICGACGRGAEAAP